MRREERRIFLPGSPDFPAEPIGEPGGLPEVAGGKGEGAEAVPVIKREEP